MDDSALLKLIGSLALWVWFLAACVVLCRELIRALREDQVQLPLWALPATIALALLLRLLFAFPWPINTVEFERLPLSYGGVHPQIYSLFATPFSMLFGNPHKWQSIFNLNMSVLSPMLLSVLGGLWSGRSVGLIAGLLLCLAPEQIRWSMTSDLSVGLMAFLLMATLATELFKRRPTAWLGFFAGSFWGVLFHFRQESPAYLLPLVVWFLGSRRLRQSVASNWIALIAPIAIALSIDTAQSLMKMGLPLPSLSELMSSYTIRLLGAVWSLIVDPGIHVLPLTIMAVIGLVSTTGPARIFSIVLLALSLMLPPIVSGFDGYTNHNIRYIIHAQPFLLWFAAVPIGRLWSASFAAGSGLIRRIVIRFAVGVCILSPTLYWQDLLYPTPLQAYDRFISTNISRLPDRGVIITDLHTNDLADLDLQTVCLIRAEGREVIAGHDLSRCEEESAYTFGAAPDLNSANVPGNCQIFYLSFGGDFEHPYIDTNGRRESRRILESSWDLEVFAQEKLDVNLGFRNNSPMEVGLYRLKRKH